MGQSTWLARRGHRLVVAAAAALVAVAASGCLSSQPYGAAVAFGDGDLPAAAREATRGPAAAAPDCRRDALEPDAAETFVYQTFVTDSGEGVRAAAEACAVALIRTARGAGPGGRFRHAAALLLPEPERDSVLGRPDAGEALLAHVLSLDPAPATATNERFTEHLARLAYAHYRYADAEAPTGLDPRGELYVRLGPPSGYKSVDFYTTELLRRIRDLQVSGQAGFTVSPSEFADNEFWLYKEPEPFFYLFVDEGAGFRQGGVLDLIPGRFRTGIDGSTNRGGAKADVLLEVLRTVFRQLSPFATEYGVQFNEVDAYLGQMEVLQKRVQARAQFAPAAGGGTLRTRRADYSAAYAQNPELAEGPQATADYVAREALAETRRVEEVLRARQADVAPAERSSLYRPPGPLHVRTARFLGPGGQTQVLAYWPEPEDRAVERARAVVLNPQRSVVADAFLGAGPRRLAWEGGSGGNGVAVQVERGGRTHVAQLGQTVPLLHGAAVEMSDVVPFRVDDVVDAGRSLRAGLGRGRVDPYPSPTLAGLAGIGLYAEVYLPPGDADVLVTYVVETRRDGGLFRRSSEDQSEQQFLRPSQGGTLPVAFLIDGAAWAGADEVELAVRVEVLATGDVVERSVRFETGAE